MDPIRLDRARMTKTPPPLLPWWMMSVITRELLKAEESEGGRNSCFILTHDNPLPNLNGPFHRNRNYSGMMDYVSYSKTSHLTSTPGFACVNASFKSAINP